MTDGPFQNTDRELWRKTPGDYFSPSVHVTQDGGIGIDIGGSVYVKPVEEWHRLAGGPLAAPAPAGAPAKVETLYVAVRCLNCGVGLTAENAAGVDCPADTALSAHVWSDNVMRFAGSPVSVTLLPPPAPDVTDEDEIGDLLAFRNHAVNTLCDALADIRVPRDSSKGSVFEQVAALLRERSGTSATREAALERALRKAAVQIGILRDRMAACDAATAPERTGHALSLFEVPAWIEEHEEVLKGSTTPSEARGSDALLDWITDEVNKGRGNVEFCLTEQDGRIGVFCRREPLCRGSGRTAGEAIQSAIRRRAQFDIDSRSTPTDSADGSK